MERKRRVPDVDVEGELVNLGHRLKKLGLDKESELCLALSEYSSVRLERYRSFIRRWAQWMKELDSKNS